MDEDIYIPQVADPNSILSSVKKLIGIVEDDESFDLDIMLNINAAISTLYQLGVVKNGFTVTSKNDTYDDFIANASDAVVNLIKMYFYYKTKLVFDSTALTSTMIEVLKEQIKETEWRLMASFNPEDSFD